MRTEEWWGHEIKVRKNAGLVDDAARAMILDSLDPVKARALLFASGAAATRIVATHGGGARIATVATHRGAAIGSSTRAVRPRAKAVTAWVMANLRGGPTPALLVWAGAREVAPREVAGSTLDGGTLHGPLSPA